MDQNWELERAIVWLIARGAKNKNMRQAEFARKAFPGHKNPESTWSQVRTGGKGGDYRRLQFVEMVALATELDEDIQQLIFRAKDMIAGGWTDKTAGSPLK